MFNETGSHTQRYELSSSHDETTIIRFHPTVLSLSPSRSNMTPLSHSISTPSSSNAQPATSTIKAGSGESYDDIASTKRQRRRWQRNIIALIAMTAWTTTIFLSLRAVHDLNGLVERRLDLFQDNMPAPTTNQYGEQSMRLSSNKFAIAYMIGGCLPEDPSYRYYFYDILISYDNMRREGSTADVVVFVQLSFKSTFEVLPDEDTRIFVDRNIQLIYIAKNEHESFYSVMLDKFRVLSLTQYDRVLFSDGDVLIRGSLDYLFELSLSGVLKENLVMAGKTEPANGGFFMLKPSDTALARVHQIVREKEARGAQLEYPHFDRRVGWGHVFDGNDHFELLSHKKLTEWAFHGDFADQGLLYQWVKYEEKSVSIVFKDGIQNWGVSPSTGEIVLEAYHRLEVLNIYSNRTKRGCWQTNVPCQPPYTDFFHFTGISKPWLRGPPDNWQTSQEPMGSWYKELDRLNRDLRLGLDFATWRTGHRPSLGFYPLHVSAAMANYSSVLV